MTIEARPSGVICTSISRTRPSMVTRYFIARLIPEGGAWQHPPVRAGDLVGERFKLLTPVGEGGMGTVFLARDTALGGDVALKILRSEDAPVERFAREVRVLATLSHPGIVRYVAHGIEPAPWLAMEWIEGGDLDARIRRSGALPLDETLRLGRALAAALGAAHARGVVHRD